MHSLCRLLWCESHDPACWCAVYSRFGGAAAQGQPRAPLYLRWYVRQTHTNYDAALFCSWRCVSPVHTNKTLHTLTSEHLCTYDAPEMAFFYRWWREQSAAMRADVRALVESGQLAFVNGGWCMHDEANTHFVGMVDQTTLGHGMFRKRTCDGCMK